MPKRLLALAVIVLPLTFVAAALAAPPTNEVTVVVDAVADDAEICADFGLTIRFVENGSFKIRTFYDREGNVVKTILSNFDQRFTSTASASGKTLSTNYPLVFITGGDDADIRVGLRTRTTFRGGSSAARRRTPHLRRKRRPRLRGWPARAPQWERRRLLRVLRLVDPDDAHRDERGQEPPLIYSSGCHSPLPCHPFAPAPVGRVCLPAQSKISAPRRSASASPDRVARSTMSAYISVRRITKKSSR